MNPFRRVGAALKAFVMTWGAGSRWRWGGVGRSRIDYRGEVSPAGSSIVQACVLWFCRTFPEAPLRVSTIDAEGDATPEPNHPMKQLLDSPNPFYSGELLWWGTLADWMISGNAYWLKVRSGSGRPVQLWWVPSTMMEPKWPDDGSSYLSHYAYSPNGVPEPIATEDVVHFRYGLDPQNVRKGLSPIASLLRELFTDDEAANYTASMLRNVGVPPVVISPGKDAKPTKDDLDEVKARYREVTTGDSRGEALVMRGETTISVLGFNPQQMDTKTSRRVPEERVSAVLGTPAVVVGLGAGLDRSTFANFAEAREAAYESNVIPSQRLLAAELRTQLLPDFGDRRTLRVDFDLSQVRVLQADQNELHTRAREDLKAGLLTRNQALEAIGEEADPDGDVLYVPLGVTPTAPADLLEGGIRPSTDRPVAPPPKLRALPGAKERKDASSLAAAMRRLRSRLQPRTEREVARFLQAQLTRAVERLGGNAKAAGDVPDAAALLEGDEARLRKVLEVIHLRSLQGVHALVEDALGIAFDLDDPTTRVFLTEAGLEIGGIHETTLQAVRSALQAGQAEGEGISELAARIRDLPAFDQARATLVARTELGQASNRAAIHTYRASGVVVGVFVLDGDSDPECAAMNGRTFALDDAPAPLQHPNCVRALTPITDAADLEAAA